MNNTLITYACRMGGVIYISHSLQTILDASIVEKHTGQRNGQSMGIWLLFTTKLNQETIPLK